MEHVAPVDIPLSTFITGWFKCFLLVTTALQITTLRDFLIHFILIDGKLRVKWMQGRWGRAYEKGLKLNCVCVMKLALFYYSDFVLHQLTVTYWFLPGAENWKTLGLKASRPSNVVDRYSLTGSKVKGKLFSETASRDEEWDSFMI